MSEPIVPVILAGGLGTRLWPMSRSEHPKQFLPLTGQESLFQKTLHRVADPVRYAPAIVMTNEKYRFLVAQQAQEIATPLSAILLEPTARNTAVAITAAVRFAADHFGPLTVLHVLASDHEVDDGENYFSAVKLAASAAAEGFLVTFGIAPTSAETGYGYIKIGRSERDGVHDIERFVEKPDSQTAQAMLAEGGYFWNSGMFMLGAETLLEECRELAPDTHSAAVASVRAARTDLDFVRLDASAFNRAPDISIDYAIFEKTTRSAVVPTSFAWSDLGTWDAVWKTREKDEAGNAANGPVTFSNASNCLVVSEKAHVAVEGLEGVAIIASEDAILVGRLDEAQKVGALVKLLRENPQSAHLTEIHRTAYRPWGGYSSILDGDRFQVKRLFVEPGKKLSLQRHHHRAEHWIVVRGTAEVTIDGTVSLLTENESIYLPLGTVHRLANPGKILLELIEVQTGAYLGEDDIVRIEDEFGRV